MTHRIRDVGIITGRFNFLHNDHVSMIRTALDHSRLGVIIHFGSANEQNTAKNPLSPQQRMEIMAEVFAAEVDANRMLFCCADDVPGNDNVWAEQIILASDVAARESWSTSLCHVVDAVWTSDKCGDGWLRQEWFKDWSPVELVPAPANALSSTDLRNIYFKHALIPEDDIPFATAELLKTLYNTDWYHSIRKQY